MPEIAPRPRPNMLPATRAATCAYRHVRGEGRSHHAALDAAVDAILEIHPELTPEQASVEAVNAVAFASSFHTAWFWAPLRQRLT